MGAGPTENATCSVADLCLLFPPPLPLLTCRVLTHLRAHAHTCAHTFWDEGPERVQNNSDPSHFMAGDRIISIQHVDVQGSDDTELAHQLLSGPMGTMVCLPPLPSFFCLPPLPSFFSLHPACGVVCGLWVSSAAFRPSKVLNSRRHTLNSRDPRESLSRVCNNVLALPRLVLMRRPQSVSLSL